MKKYLSFLLALLMIGVVFSSCGNKTNEDNTVTNAQNNDYAAIVSEKAKTYKKNGNPIAVIIMENGDTIVAELYLNQAPNTVRNFISLANSGFYDNVIFHRCIQDFVIQGGDPLGTGTGGPGYCIKGEFKNNGVDNTLKHGTGVLSMARQGSQLNPASLYNTAGSQFFICVSDSASVKNLDDDYAAFGSVLEGMDTVNKIVSVETDANNKPLEEQKMVYVRVETFGVTYEEPITLAK